jgi:hypothetical protein
VKNMAIDFISFGPAIFGALLSAYNWLQTKKPANIRPNKIIEYAIVNSSYDEVDILTVPLIFNNNGAFKGTITDIKIGFKNGNDIKYLDIMGKARLSELSTDQLITMAAEAYSKEGYSITMPTYPIDVFPNESTSIVLIATADHSENLIPLDIDAEWVVETYYDNKKKNKDEFPFKLTKEMHESAEYLIWTRSV